MKTWRDWNIPANAEYRFEVDHDATATIKLISGTAEVFGAELAPNREYTFSGQKVAIFSFDSAVVSVCWSATTTSGGAIGSSGQVEYVSTESVATPHYLHLYTHELATSHRVLILGSGRNTLTRTLSNYRVRQNKPVLWASVDVRTTPLFFPGCLTAMEMGAVQVVEAEEEGMVSGMAAEACSPFTLFFGSTTITDNYKLWLRAVERLSAACATRLTGMSEQLMIICGPGEQECEAIPTLPEDLIKAMNVDLVVVVGNERLHARLQRQLAQKPNNNLKLVKLAKSGGQVPFPRPNQHDLRRMHRLFNNYFYGQQRQLNPFSQTLQYPQDFMLYRWLLGSDDVAPMSALPLGATRKLDECRLVKAEPTSSLLLYSVIAVLYSDTAVDTDPSAIDYGQTGNVAGFLYVTAVDEQRQTITVLSPCPGQPPSKLFVCGKLKWIE